MRQCDSGKDESKKQFFVKLSQKIANHSIFLKDTEDLDIFKSRQFIL
jgi:hypothetical protein